MQICSHKFNWNFNIESNKGCFYLLKEYSRKLPDTSYLFNQLLWGSRMSPTLTSIQGFFQKQCYALLHQLAVDLFLPTPITPPDKRRASKKKKKKLQILGLPKEEWWLSRPGRRVLIHGNHWVHHGASWRVSRRNCHISSRVWEYIWNKRPGYISDMSNSECQRIPVSPIITEQGERGRLGWVSLCKDAQVSWWQKGCHKKITNLSYFEGIPHKKEIC